MTRTRSLSVARGFRRAALPMASYYAVTLALPLANGAAPSGAFVEHALVVLIVPPVAVMLACAVYTGAHALGRACRAGACGGVRAAASHFSERRHLEGLTKVAPRASPEL
jgi:hypothetical protein